MAELTWSRKMNTRTFLFVLLELVAFCGAQKPNIGQSELSNRIERDKSKQRILLSRSFHSVRHSRRPGCQAGIFRGARQNTESSHQGRPVL